MGSEATCRVLFSNIGRAVLDDLNNCVNSVLYVWDWCRNYVFYANWLVCTAVSTVRCATRCLRSAFCMNRCFMGSVARIVMQWHIPNCVSEGVFSRLLFFFFFFHLHSEICVFTNCEKKNIYMYLGSYDCLCLFFWRSFWHPSFATHPASLCCHEMVLNLSTSIEFQYGTVQDPLHCESNLGYTARKI